MTAPSTGGADLDIVVTDTTKNQGTGSSLPSKTGFYLSTNLTLDGTDVWLGSRPVTSLGPGVTNQVSTTLHIPPSTGAGLYYIVAKADWEGRVTENSETNNVRQSGAIKIGPDLIVSSVVGASDCRRWRDDRRIGYYEEPGGRQLGHLGDALLLVDEYNFRRVGPAYRQSVRSAHCSGSIGQLHRNSHCSGDDWWRHLLRDCAGRWRKCSARNDRDQQHEGQHGHQGRTRLDRECDVGSRQRGSRRHDISDRHYEESRCRDSGCVVHRILPVCEYHRRTRGFIHRKPITRPARSEWDLDCIDTVADPGRHRTWQLLRRWQGRLERQHRRIE